METPARTKSARKNPVLRKLGETLAPDIRMPDISALRRIREVANLSDARLIALANKLRVNHAHDRELLIQVGSTESCSIYVISGKVSLRAYDGNTRIVAASDSREIRPVAQLRPSIYDVSAVGPVSYLRIERGKLIDSAKLSDEEISNIGINTTLGGERLDGNSTLAQLHRELSENSDKLPALPSVAMQVQAAYRGPSTDVEALTRVLQSHPDFTRIIFNLARCSGDNNLDEKEKIHYSIAKLGMLTVYCLVMTHALGLLTRRLPVNHMHRVKPLWDHSLNVAAVARILAKWTGAISPDLAMLAGLLHGIGELLFDERLLDHRRHRLDHLEIDHAIQLMRPEISGLLMRKWNFSAELVTVVEHNNDWSRDEDDTPDLCDLVIAANYYVLLHGRSKASLPPAMSVPALEKLRITPELAAEAIRKSIEVKRNIKKLLV